MLSRRSIFSSSSVMSFGLSYVTVGASAFLIWKRAGWLPFGRGMKAAFGPCAAGIGRMSEADIPASRCKNRTLCQTTSTTPVGPRRSHRHFLREVAVSPTFVCVCLRQLSLCRRQVSDLTRAPPAPAAGGTKQQVRGGQGDFVPIMTGSATFEAGRRPNASVPSNMLFGAIRLIRPKPIGKRN